MKLLYSFLLLFVCWQVPAQSFFSVFRNSYVGNDMFETDSSLVFWTSNNQQITYSHVDLQGNLQGKTTLSATQVGQTNWAVLQLHDTAFYFLGNFITPNGNGVSWNKCNHDGQIEWTLRDSFQYNYFTGEAYLLEHPSGKVTALYNNVYTRFDSVGQVLWRRNYGGEEVYKMLAVGDSTLVWKESGLYLMDGQGLNLQLIYQSFYQQPQYAHFAEYQSGHFVFAHLAQTSGGLHLVRFNFDAGLQLDDTLLLNTALNQNTAYFLNRGDTLFVLQRTVPNWTGNWPSVFTFLTVSIPDMAYTMIQKETHYQVIPQLARNGGFYMYGSFSMDNAYLAWLPDFDNYLPQGISTGHIYFDANGDCQQAYNERSLGHSLITLEHQSSGQEHYILAQSDGGLIARLDTGAYTVDWLSTRPAMTIDCPADTSFVQDQSSGLQLAIQSTLNCEEPTVDIFMSPARAGRDSRLRLIVQNRGTVNLSSIQVQYLDLKLNPYLEIQFASVPYTKITPDFYRLTLNSFNSNLPINSSITVDLTVRVATNTPQNYEHFVEARLSSEQACNYDPWWDGSDLTVTGTCSNNLASFSITNSGWGNMVESVQYHLFERSTLLQQGMLQLQVGEVFNLTQAVNGQALRLQVAQTNHHPLKNIRPSFTLQTCPQMLNNAEMGFPLNDAAPSSAMYSRRTIPITTVAGGAEVSAIPYGLGPDRVILPGEEIRYTLRVQNPLNRVATTVVIYDTLDSNLDISTLRLVHISHQHIVELLDNQILKITLQDANLVRYVDNPITCQAYVVFYIKAKTDLPDGTIIQNRMSAIFNNTYSAANYWHTINPVAPIWNSSGEVLTGLFPSLSPNPAYHACYFEQQGQVLAYDLYSLDGLMIQAETQCSPGQNKISLEYLPQGIYIVQFTLLDGRKATSKIVHLK